MSNAYVKLKQILPPAPVLVGLVTAHHDEDDTSTVVLPTQEGRIEYAAGVAVGSTIRARGTTVPVGDKAFVRNGVIETRAPDGDAIEIEIGRVVPPAPPLVFSGPIDDLSGTVGAAFSESLAGYWSGGVGALGFTVAGGSLPAGLALSATGVLAGTPTAEGTAAGVVVRATDRAGYTADSGPFDVTIAAGATSWVLDTFSTDGTLASRDGEVGAAWSTGGAFSHNKAPSDAVVSGGRMYLPAAGDSNSTTYFASGQVPATGNVFVEVEFVVPSGHSGRPMIGLTLASNPNATADRIISQSLAEPTYNDFATSGWRNLGGSYSSLGSTYATPFAADVTKTLRVELIDGRTTIRILLDGVLQAGSSSNPAIGAFYVGVEIYNSQVSGARSADVLRVEAGPLA